MKSFAIVLFLEILIVLSCNKKDATRQETITSTTTSSTPTVTVGSPATFDCLCSNQKILLVLNNFTNLQTVVQNSAVFTNSTLTNFSLPSAGINAGTINLNGKNFKKDINNYYTDTTNTYQTGPMNWIGSGSVAPTFTYVNYRAYPTYADYTLWPDTIKKGREFKIYMKSIVDADEAELLIANTGGNNVSTYTAMVAAGSINVGTVSILGLSTASTAVIQCSFYKNNIKDIAGKQINFRNVTTFVKTVTVTN